VSETADWSCEPWAVDSSEAAALRSHLLYQAEAVDEIASRMCSVAALDWESPAGRNFRDYVVTQLGGVRQASELLRDAASRVGAFASTLRSLEYNRFLARDSP